MWIQKGYIEHLIEFLSCGRNQKIQTGLCEGFIAWGSLIVVELKCEKFFLFSLPIFFFFVPCE